MFNLSMLMFCAFVKDHYQNIVQGKHDVVESHLQGDLLRHINHEIVHNSVRSLADAASWLRSTFLFVRITQNSGHYYHSQFTNVEEYVTGMELNRMTRMSQFVEISIHSIRLCIRIAAQPNARRASNRCLRWASSTKPAPDSGAQVTDAQRHITINIIQSK